MKQGFSNIFGQINGSIQSFISKKFGQQQTGEEGETPNKATFTITPSVSDIESARCRDEPAVESPEEVKDFDSTLATFYDEITNAARQVFAGKLSISSIEIILCSHTYDSFTFRGHG